MGYIRAIGTAVPETTYRQQDIRQIDLAGGQITLHGCPVFTLIGEDKAHPGFALLRGGEHRHFA